MPFKIVRNDITKMQVDAIVNTANKEPVYSTGTDAAVYQAAGAEALLAARKQIGVLQEGEAAITAGFRLPAKYIIHAVSPRYIDGTCGEADRLRSCYMRSLELAHQYHCESIAFPLIATGNFGYPKAEGLEIALQVIHNFLMQEEMMIYLVVFDQESVRLSGQLYEDIESFIDEHYVAEKQDIEYGPLFAPCAPNIPANIPEKLSTRQQAPGKRFRKAAKEVGIPLEAEESSRVLPDTVKVPDFPTDAVKMSNLPDDTVKNACSPENTAKAFGASVKAPKLRTLDDLVNNVGETFQQMLFRLIDEKGREDVEVYKGAGKDKKLFYKIRSNINYQPTKHTVYAFALSLRLSLDETKDLLQTAGFAMSGSNRFDLIMRYVFEQGIYDLYKIDCILYDFGEEHYFSCE